ncbi:MAG: Peptidyl-prolyl cis-trans isomerase [Labilithrix sp.]|nr:Peptidyl-prolyl cis-trans isomerase [Labilithrix sp.]
MLVVCALGVGAWSCGSSGNADVPDEAAGPEAGALETSTPMPEGGPVPDGSTSDGAIAIVDTSSANRDRLLATYLAYLKANPGAQSNGLDGSKLADVCALWRTLVPSAQAVYLTLTARLQSSKISADGSSMLAHVTKLYRIAGGDGATAVDPGQCGGDGNRLFLSMDAHLHDALIAASTNKGQPTGGAPDIADVPIGAGSYWRDSHDLGGSHAPFDISDETENGAPRGQVQYFEDPASAAAKAPLDRTDLKTLVDPYTLEVDQDYDCPHDSNPACAYTSYGSLCIPGPSKKGTELYTEKYGSFDPTWQPADCAGK